MFSPKIRRKFCLSLLCCFSLAASGVVADMADDGGLFPGSGSGSGTNTGVGNNTGSGPNTGTGVPPGDSGTGPGDSGSGSSPDMPNKDYASLVTQMISVNSMEIMLNELSDMAETMVHNSQKLLHLSHSEKEELKQKMSSDLGLAMALATEFAWMDTGVKNAPKEMLDGLATIMRSLLGAAATSHLPKPQHNQGELGLAIQRIVNAHYGAVGPNPTQEQLNAINSAYNYMGEVIAQTQWKPQAIEAAKLQVANQRWMKGGTLPPAENTAEDAKQGAILDMMHQISKRMQGQQSNANVGRQFLLDELNRVNTNFKNNHIEGSALRLYFLYAMIPQYRDLVTEEDILSLKQGTFEFLGRLGAPIQDMNIPKPPRPPRNGGDNPELNKAVAEFLGHMYESMFVSGELDAGFWAFPPFSHIYSGMNDIRKDIKQEEMGEAYDTLREMGGAFFGLLNTPDYQELASLIGIIGTGVEEIAAREDLYYVSNELSEVINGLTRYYEGHPTPEGYDALMGKLHAMQDQVKAHEFDDARNTWAGIQQEYDLSIYAKVMSGGNQKMVQWFEKDMSDATHRLSTYQSSYIPTAPNEPPLESAFPKMGKGMLSVVPVGSLTGDAKDVKFDWEGIRDIRVRKPAPMPRDDTIDTIPPNTVGRTDGSLLHMIVQGETGESISYIGGEKRGVGPGVSGTHYYASSPWNQKDAFLGTDLEGKVFEGIDTKQAKSTATVDADKGVMIARLFTPHVYGDGLLLPKRFGTVAMLMGPGGQFEPMSARAFMASGFYYGMDGSWKYLNEDSPTQDYIHALPATGFYGPQDLAPDQIPGAIGMQLAMGGPSIDGRDSDTFVGTSMFLAEAGPMRWVNLPEEEDFIGIFSGPSVKMGSNDNMSVGGPSVGFARFSVKKGPHNDKWLELDGLQNIVRDAAGGKTLEKGMSSDVHAYTHDGQFITQLVNVDVNSADMRPETPIEKAMKVAAGVTSSHAAIPHPMSNTNSFAYLALMGDNYGVGSVNTEGEMNGMVTPGLNTMMVAGVPKPMGDRPNRKFRAQGVFSKGNYMPNSENGMTSDGYFDLKIDRVAPGLNTLRPMNYISWDVDNHTVSFFKALVDDNYLVYSSSQGTNPGTREIKPGLKMGEFLADRALGNMMMSDNHMLAFATKSLEKPNRMGKGGFVFTTVPDIPEGAMNQQNYEITTGFGSLGRRENPGNSLYGLVGMANGVEFTKNVAGGQQIPMNPHLGSDPHFLIMGKGQLQKGPFGGAQEGMGSTQPMSTVTGMTKAKGAVNIDSTYTNALTVGGFNRDRPAVYQVTAGPQQELADSYSVRVYNALPEINPGADGMGVHDNHEITEMNMMLEGSSANVGVDISMRIGPKPPGAENTGLKYYPKQVLLVPDEGSVQSVKEGNKTNITFATNQMKIRDLSGCAENQDPVAKDQLHTTMASQYYNEVVFNVPGHWCSPHDNLGDMKSTLADRYSNLGLMELRPADHHLFKGDTAEGFDQSIADKTYKFSVTADSEPMMQDVPYNRLMDEMRMVKALRENPESKVVIEMMAGGDKAMIKGTLDNILAFMDDPTSGNVDIDAESVRPVDLQKAQFAFPGPLMKPSSFQEMKKSLQNIDMAASADNIDVMWGPKNSDAPLTELASLGADNAATFWLSLEDAPGYRESDLYIASMDQIELLPAIPFNQLQNQMDDLMQMIGLAEGDAKAVKISWFEPSSNAMDAVEMKIQGTYDLLDKLENGRMPKKAFKNVMVNGQPFTKDQFWQELQNLRLQMDHVSGLVMGAEDDLDMFIKEAPKLLEQTQSYVDGFTQFLTQASKKLPESTLRNLEDMIVCLRFAKTFEDEVTKTKSGTPSELLDYMAQKSLPSNLSIDGLAQHESIEGVEHILKKLKLAREIKEISQGLPDDEKDANLAIKVSKAVPEELKKGALGSIFSKVETLPEDANARYFIKQMGGDQGIFMPLGSASHLKDKVEKLNKSGASINTQRGDTLVEGATLLGFLDAVESGAIGQEDFDSAFEGVNIYAKPSDLSLLRDAANQGEVFPGDTVTANNDDSLEAGYGFVKAEVLGFNMMMCPTYHGFSQRGMNVPGDNYVPGAQTSGMSGNSDEPSDMPPTGPGTGPGMSQGSSPDGGSGGMSDEPPLIPPEGNMILVDRVVATRQGNQEVMAEFGAATDPVFVDNDTFVLADAKEYHGLQNLPVNNPQSQLMIASIPEAGIAGITIGTWSTTSGPGDTPEKLMFGYFAAGPQKRMSNPFDLERFCYVNEQPVDYYGNAVADMMDASDPTTVDRLKGMATVTVDPNSSELTKGCLELTSRDSMISFGLTKASLSATIDSIKVGGSMDLLPVNPDVAYQSGGVNFKANSTQNVGTHEGVFYNNGYRPLSSLGSTFFAEVDGVSPDNGPVKHFVTGAFAVGQEMDGGPGGSEGPGGPGMP